MEHTEIWSSDGDTEVVDRTELARLRRVEAASRDLLDQIEGIGIEDWHGAEGLDLSTLRDALGVR